jgi:hypothetical protein
MKKNGRREGVLAGTHGHKNPKGRGRKGCMSRITERVERLVFICSLIVHVFSSQALVGRASYNRFQDLTAFPMVKFRRRPGSTLLHFSLLFERGGEGGMFSLISFQNLYCLRWQRRIYQMQSPQMSPISRCGLPLQSNDFVSGNTSMPGPASMTLA